MTRYLRSRARTIPGQHTGVGYRIGQAGHKGRTLASVDTRSLHNQSSGHGNTLVRAASAASHSCLMTSPLGRRPTSRVAIVTGGSRGVGRAIVRSLAARGYAVVVNYLHDQHAAESTVEAVLADNGSAVAVRADVADELDVERLFAETDWMFGGVDVVVHTVQAQVSDVPLAEASLDRFDDWCRINTRAAFIVNREAARQLRSGGTIINLTSSVADSALSSYGAYAATTAATGVLTRVLAAELRQREITVRAAALQVDRACDPNKVAYVVTCLLTNDRNGRAQ